MNCVVRAADIHARILWPAVLERLGIDASFLRNKHGPCPACGGKDRYRFDNRRGRGDFYCNGCGPGDGFALLQRVHHWSFSEARKRVVEASGIRFECAMPATVAGTLRTNALVAAPTRRVLRVLRSRCAVADCPDAIAYLQSRELWPLPAGFRLRAHAGLEYWDDARQIGHFPALIADVRDIAGELVTVHVTYLRGGRKLTEHEPRKLLSPLTGRTGCAVRLMPLAGSTLGIGEGIETCLSAALLERLPVWAALNTTLLAKFEPPPGVTTLRVYADRDEAGLHAAGQLVERLQGRGMRAELRPPPSPAKDWNDVLVARSAPTPTRRGNW